MKTTQKSKIFRNIVNSSWLAVSVLLLSFSPLSVAGKKVEHKTIDSSFENVRLIIGSDKLYRKVKLTKARVMPRGNFKKGDVEIKNLTNQRIDLEYRFDWLDDGGFTAADAGIWQRFTLGPRDIRSFRSMGKSKDAAKMQFIVRYPNDDVAINTPIEQ